MVPAAVLLHLVLAWEDCSADMVVMPVPQPSAIRVRSARFPISSSASSKGGSSLAPALRAAIRRTASARPFDAKS